MIHTWRSLVDYIFGISDSLMIIRAHKRISITNYYDKRTVNGVVTLSSYHISLIKACIRAGKFEHNIEALSLLSKLLEKYLLDSNPITKPEHTIFVPIPLHTKRELSRGYNQVEVIVQNAITNSSYRIQKLLKRTINTSPQSQLKRKERLSHLKNAFVYQKLDIDWSTISTVILIDDVMTSGSTLNSARDALLPHLPKHIQLISLAIAH